MKKILKTLAIQLLTEDKTELEIEGNNISFTLDKFDIDVTIFVDNFVENGIIDLVTLIDNDELSIIQIIISQI